MIAAAAVRHVQMALPAPVDVYVSAGSNIEPIRHLRMACRAIKERFGPLSVSSVYQNRAVGFEGEDFLNLVLRFATTEPAGVIVGELERLHRVAGRVRGANPFSPRTLDLDLLLYGAQVNGDPGIRVPREDIRQYGFVLGPLAELAPGLEHPVTGDTMAALWQRFDQTRNPLQRVAIRLA